MQFVQVWIFVVAVTRESGRRKLPVETRKCCRAFRSDSHLSHIGFFLLGFDRLKDRPSIADGKRGRLSRPSPRGDVFLLPVISRAFLTNSTRARGRAPWCVAHATTPRIQGKKKQAP